MNKNPFEDLPPEEDLIPEIRQSGRPIPELIPGEFYYEIKRAKFWFKDDKGAWTYSALQPFAKHLAATKNLVVNKRKDELISETDQYINKVIRQAGVNNVASLAGYSADTLLYFAGKRILVPDGPTLIVPVGGVWPLTRIVLEGLLEGIQFEHFLWWLSFAIKCQRGGACRPGQAVFFCGKRDSGKSLLQALLTLWFGGRASQPFRYMSGSTSFNAEIYAAEHAMIEDDGSATDIKTRRKFTDMIKEFTAKREHSVHPKFQDAFTSPALFIRLTISLNDEPESMTLIPANEEAINDKIIIYKVGKKAMPMPTGNPEEEGIFMAALAAEAPAFLHYLLNEVTIPEEWRSSRFGVLHYHHTDITQTRDAMSPAKEFLEIIDLELFEQFKREEPLVNLTAKKIETLLLANDSTVRESAKRLLYWSNACGTYLGHLAKLYPNRVTRKHTNINRFWTIQPPYPLERIFQ